MIRPGLERISLLLKDVPLTWRAIHVAGTNGKGSICHYVSGMLQAAKLRTGRFTSPHLIDRWDGIAIDNEPVSKALFEEIEDRVKWKNERHSIGASEFELLTATAFQIFNKEKIQVGVIECGMGGRLDSTNVLRDPIVAVISRIGLDHQGFLGDTIEEIAAEKAGIIKEGTTCVVSGQNSLGVLKVIAGVAKANKALFVKTPSLGNSAQISGSELSTDLFGTGFRHQLEQSGVEQSETDSVLFSSLFRQLGIEQSSLMEVQLQNIWTAYLAVLYSIPILATMENFAAGLNLDPIASPEQVYHHVIAPTMKDIAVSGRAQQIDLTPILGYHKQVFMDGAHNEQALRALGGYVHQKLRPQAPNGAITWLVARTEGRDATDFFRCCTRTSDRVVLVEFGPVAGMPWVKSMSAPKLVSTAQDFGITKVEEYGVKVERGMRRACRIAGEGPVVITGSLYLVSEVMRILRDALTVD